METANRKPEMDTLVEELRGLQLVAELEDAAQQLTGWDVKEAEGWNDRCYELAAKLRTYFAENDIAVESYWGEDGDFSIYLASSERANGRAVRGPVIADCKQAY